jgi:hypothetical protein
VPVQAQAQAQAAEVEPAYGSRCEQLFAIEVIEAEFEAGATPVLADADGNHAHEADGDEAAEDEAAEDEAAGDEMQLERLLRCQALDVAPQDTPARRAIVEILQDPQFGQLKQVERWRLREDFDSDDDPRRREDLGAIEQFFELLASLWQILTWIALALLLLYLGRAIARRWQGGAEADSNEAAPAELFGLSIAPDSLPDDVVGTALAWLEQGHTREALALLYRATLSQLVHHHGLRLPAGATEADVLRRTRSALAGSAHAYLSDLIRAWIDLAYAERQLPTDRLRALIQSHPGHFPDRAGIAADLAADGAAR